MKLNQNTQPEIRYELFHQRKGMPNFVFHSNRHKLGSGHFIIIGTQDKKVFHFAFLDELINEKLGPDDDQYWIDLANELQKRLKTAVKYIIYKKGQKPKTYKSEKKKK